MSTRTKAEVIADVKAFAKELSAKADEVGDCGGLQCAAVLRAFPEMNRRLESLEAEAKAMGITPDDMKPQ